jgi:hypothetical protein
VFVGRDGCARGCPCPVAGRSLRPSWASLTRMLTALRHPACADQSAETDRCPSIRRLSGAWAAPHGCRKEHRATRPGGPCEHRRAEARQGKVGRMPSLAVKPMPGPRQRAEALAWRRHGGIPCAAPETGGFQAKTTRCRVSREVSIGPAGRGRPGPAACRWCWRRATSCRWRSAAEDRRASAAWPVASGWSRPACPAETGCSTAGPDC